MRNPQRLRALLVAVGMMLTVSTSAYAQAPPPLSGADRTNSGCAWIPLLGSSANDLCYRVSVGIVPATGGQRVQSWMHVRNIRSQPISFVVCAMLQREGAKLTWDGYWVVPGSSGSWVFPNHTNPWERKNSPPSYHFACRQIVDVAPDAVRTVYDQVFDFRDAAGQVMSTGPSDIHSIYWDLLTNGTVEPVGNAAVTGHNNWLVPTNETSTMGTNIWAGTTSFDPEGFAQILFPLGNWVTMAHPGIYEAEFIGRVFGASPGTTLVLSLGGEVQTRIEVGPESAEDPFAIEFLIDSEFDENAVVELSADPGSLDEGQWVSLQGQVFATRESEFYRPGDFMYATASNVVRDTVAPEILETALRLDEHGLISVRAIAGDDSSMPAAASVEFLVGGESVETFALNFAATEEAAELEAVGLVLFETSINYLDALLAQAEAGAGLAYRINVVDEGQNLGQTGDLAIDVGLL